MEQYMLNNPIRIIPLALACTMLTACGGDDSGPSIPADAITITSTNAGDVTSLTLDDLDSVFDYKTSAKASSNIPAASGLMGLVSSFTYNKSTTPVTHSAVDVEPCTGGGDSTSTYTINGNTVSGTFVETNCNDGDGYITNGSGSFTYTESETQESGTTSANTVNVQEILSGDNFSFTNFSTAYSTQYVTPFISSNSITFVLTGVDGFGGFLFQTTSNIVTDINHCSPYQGVIIISGANSSRLRITFMENNLYEVALDSGTGTFSILGNDIRLRCT
jgi:hypothetical protein